jgi:hypothetical protein
MLHHMGQSPVILLAALSDIAREEGGGVMAFMMFRAPDKFKSFDLIWHADSRWERNLFIGKLYVGTIRLWVSDVHKNLPWYAWVQDSEDGHRIGWYATEAEAKAALEAAVRNLIGADG